MKFFIELLPVLLILLAGWFTLKWATRAYRARRDYEQTHRVIERHVARRELERRVLPHLAEDERDLPYTMDELRTLDEIYADKADRIGA